MKKFPRLYQLSTVGNIKVYDVEVDNATYTKTYGQLDGKMQTASKTITEGKNLGKSNETTPEQQALLEAEASWLKKKKEGYVESLEDARLDVVDATVITGGVEPMLAHDFKKHKSKIVYPCIAQPKLDGIRCVAVINNGDTTLWTRTRKPITGVPHIVEALNRQFHNMTIILDGELYNHDFKDNFEDIVSLVRQEKPKEGHEIIQYYVYDEVDSRPFQERGRYQFELPMVMVKRHSVGSEEEAMRYFTNLLDLGYEGMILRNSNSPYENKRSYHLQKVKEFQDAEFKIIGLEEGEGILKGCAIYVCENSEGKTFNVKGKGAHADLAAVWESKSCIGQYLTVQFQGYTNTGLPRFPIGLRVRVPE